MALPRQNLETCTFTVCVLQFQLSVHTFDMCLIAGIGQIILSWAPLGRSCVGLRKDITKRAQYHWLDTVMKCCHRPSCDHTLQQRLSLDVSELVGAFNELGPMLFETGYFDIKCLCDWLANHVSLSASYRVLLQSVHFLFQGANRASSGTCA